MAEIESYSFSIDKKDNRISLTDEGIDELEVLMMDWPRLSPKNLFAPENHDIVHCIYQLLSATHLYKCDIDYFVRDGKVIIIDKNTGRAQPDRRYSNSLHQALEIKEGLEIAARSLSLASISYQKLFSKYENLCGMTGTAYTSRDEFLDVYGMNVSRIDLNTPSKRVDHNDILVATREDQMAYLRTNQ